MSWTVEGVRKKMSRRTPSRRRDLLEIFLPYALILGVIWTPRPIQKWMWCVAAAVILVIAIISWEGRDAMGLRWKNFLRSSWIIVAAMAAATIAVVAAGHLHTLVRHAGPVWVIENYWLYAVWSFAQQFLLQCFFLERFMRLLPRAWQAALATAVLFSLAHMPSYILVPSTLLWGFAACMLFIRYRNLYPLAIAHAILGITIAITIPGRVDHNMRVGLGYLRYNPGVHQRHLWMGRSPQP
ncbi:MAG TPA: CPBP family intramembrane glutamic endopeptidase [Terracidiphilus sp.]